MAATSGSGGTGTRGERAREVGGRAHTGLQRAGQRQGLVRVRQGQLLAGVFAGLGRRFGVSPWILRAAFVVSMIVPGPQFLLYLALWVLMPHESRPV